MPKVLTADGICDEYEDDVWFKKALGRLWPGFEQRLKTLLNGDLAKILPSPVSKITCSKRTWRKVLARLTAFTTDWVSYHASKTTAVRSKYLTAVTGGAGAGGRRSVGSPVLLDRASFARSRVG